MLAKIVMVIDVLVKRARMEMMSARVVQTVRGSAEIMTSRVER
jgi:hypothetical protein